MKRKFLFVCLAAFALCGCKRTVNLHFTEEFMAYTQFKEGSVWVYQDSLTATLDTVTLAKNEWDIFHYKPEHSASLEDFPTCEYDELHSDFVRNSFKSSLQPQGFLYYTSVATCDGFQSYESYRFQPVFFANNPTFAPTTKEGDSYQGSFFKTMYTEYLDSISILGKNYYQVRVFKKDGDVPSDGYVTIYWAKNVGIIKKQLINGQIWYLKEAKVAQ